MKRKHQGFTLIELMIVVAIIGILAAVAVPNFVSYQYRTKRSEGALTIKGVLTAERASNVQLGGYINLPARPSTAHSAPQAQDCITGGIPGPARCSWGPLLADCSTADYTSPDGHAYECAIGFKPSDMTYFSLEGASAAFDAAIKPTTTLGSAGGTVGDNAYIVALSDLDGDNVGAEYCVRISNIHGEYKDTGVALFAADTDVAGVTTDDKCYSSLAADTNAINNIPVLATPPDTY